MYAIKTAACGLMPHPFDDLEAAKKEASGFLLSRSKERKAEVLQVIPGAPPAGWPTIWIVSRKRAGGELKWQEVKPPS